MKQKIITRVVLLVSVVSLFTDIASEMLYPVMPVYLQSIGFSVILIGVLEGLAEATAGISKGYFGNLSDRLGKRVPFIKYGYGLSAISKPLMAAFTLPLWVFFARTLDRLGKGIRTSARDALLSDEATPATKGRVFGFHRSLDTVGAAIGPLIALAFLAFYPGQYRWMFVLAFIPGVIALILTGFLKDKSRKVKTEVPWSKSLFGYLHYWKRSVKSYKHLVIGLLIFTLFNSSDAFLLLNTKIHLGNDSQMIGFYIFYNLIYALLSYPLGMLADKIGLKSIMIFGLFIFAGVYFFMGFATSWLHFGILFFAYAIYAAATEGVSKALISTYSKPEETATAIGFYTSFASVFALLASSLAGLLWYTLSSKYMFIISSTGVLLSAIYLLITLSRNKTSKKMLIA